MNAATILLAAANLLLIAGMLQDRGLGRGIAVALSLMAAAIAVGFMLFS